MVCVAWRVCRAQRYWSRRRRDARRATPLPRAPETRAREVVHGGIGDGGWKLDDLRHIQRPLEEPLPPWLHNIMWSDPIEDDADKEAVFGVHESPRGGVTARFGWNVTQTFCARNGVDLVVRSHQSKRGSVGFDIMHENRLIRVFSARDYEGHCNDGAVLNLTASINHPGLLLVRMQVLRSATKFQTEGSCDLGPYTSEGTWGRSTSS